MLSADDIAHYINIGDWQRIVTYQNSQHPNTVIDVTGQTIRVAEVRGVHIRNMDFSNSQLNLAFRNITFENCLFKGAVLHNCMFDGCTFRDVDFSGADVTAVSFFKPVDFIKCKFSENTKFRNCTFSNSDLSHAHFEKIDFSASVFTQANLENATFKETNLTNANFQEAQIQNANFSLSNLTDANFTHIGKNNPVTADFADCKIDRTKFLSIRLYKSNLSGCKGSKPDFREVSLHECNLAGMQIFNSPFHKSSLKNCNLHEASFKDCNFEESAFDDSNFSGSSWEDCNFTRTRWLSAKIDSKTKLSHPMFNSEHVALLDKSDTVIYPKVFCYFDWQILSKLGNLPMFGISWTALAFALLYVNTVGLLNEHQFIQTFKYPIPIPDGMVFLLITNVILVIGSTIFRLMCPRRVSEFSEGAWVEVHKHARILYLLEKIAHPRWQAATVVFLVGGAALAIGQFIYRFSTAIGYTLTQWHPF